ncbi:MAG: hypothetical protein JXD23_13515 [Spirochaetales bacterium]|nr:hypothetical protein [Spirochaetales bacterium]
MRKTLAFAAAGLVLGGVFAFAQVGTRKIESDARVEKLLKDAEIKYTVDNEGDFKIYMKVRNDRLQGMWIISETQNVGSLEVRQVWSIGYVSDAPLSPAVTTKLLEQNAKVKLGAWQERKMGDKYVAVFSAQVGAEVDKFTLLTCMSAVATTADDMEQELSGKDVY